MNRLLAMNHDTAAAEGLRIGRGQAIVRGQQIVIDDGPTYWIRDLDPEAVRRAASDQGAIASGQDEIVVTGSVDRPCTLVLSHWSGDHQPLVKRTVEVELGDLEIELRLSRW